MWMEVVLITLLVWMGILFCNQRFKKSLVSKIPMFVEASPERLTFTTFEQQRR